MPRVAVSTVVPTYNGQPLLAKHLPSVEAALTADDELLIIDDAGQDSTLAWLTERYDLQQVSDFSRDIQITADDKVQASYWRGRKAKTALPVTVIVNKQNLRFGATVNRAVRAAQHSLIFLLNNDVQPSRDILNVLTPHFSDSLMFAVGCHEQEGEGRSRSAGKNTLWFERGMFRHSRADNFETGETAWVSGGSGLFDRVKWEILGGFDRLFYPAYWEDIDLSVRAKQRGWRVWFDAHALVEHHHETTNSTAFGQRRIAEMSWRNARRFTWRHAHGWQRWWAVVWTPYNWYQRWRQSR